MPEPGKRYLRVDQNGCGEASGAAEVRALTRLKTQETCYKAFRTLLIVASGLYAAQGVPGALGMVSAWLSPLF